MKSFADIAEEICRENLKSKLCYHCGERPATETQLTGTKVCKGCYSSHLDVLILSAQMMKALEERFKK